MYKYNERGVHVRCINDRSVNSSVKTVKYFVDCYEHFATLHLFFVLFFFYERGTACCSIQKEERLKERSNSLIVTVKSPAPESEHSELGHPDHA